MEDIIFVLENRLENFLETAIKKETEKTENKKFHAGKAAGYEMAKCLTADEANGIWEILRKKRESGEMGFSASHKKYIPGSGAYEYIDGYAAALHNYSETVNEYADEECYEELLAVLGKLEGKEFVKGDVEKIFFDYFNRDMDLVIEEDLENPGNKFISAKMFPSMYFYFEMDGEKIAEIK